MEKLNVDAQGDVRWEWAGLLATGYDISDLQLKRCGRHEFVSDTYSLSISQSLATGIRSGSSGPSGAHRTGGVVDRNCLHSMDLLLLEASDWGTGGDQDVVAPPNGKRVGRICKVVELLIRQ